MSRLYDLSASFFHYHGKVEHEWAVIECKKIVFSHEWQLFRCLSLMTFVYARAGSLTTPPCTETMQFLIQSGPMQVCCVTYLVSNALVGWTMSCQEQQNSNPTLNLWTSCLVTAPSRLCPPSPWKDGRPVLTSDPIYHVIHNIQVSMEQLKAVQKLIPYPGNSRPQQLLNNRRVYLLLSGVRVQFGFAWCSKNDFIAPTHSNTNQLTQHRQVTYYSRPSVSATLPYRWGPKVTTKRPFHALPPAWAREEYCKNK